MTDGALTRTQQESEVGEGLAVGCLVADVLAVTASGPPLGVAFRAAWAAWPWRVRYPALSTTDDALDRLLARSAGRRHSRIAQWNRSGGQWVPQLRDDDWDLPAAAADLEETTAIAVRHWRTLAVAFVDGLDDEAVSRASPR